MATNYGRHTLQKQFNQVTQHNKSEDKENWSPNSKRRYSQRVPICVDRLLFNDELAD